MFGVIVLASLAVVAVAGAIGYEIADHICSQIRGYHPDVWQELDCPDSGIDDFGMAKHAAVYRLSRKPALLRRCNAKILNQVKFWRVYAKALTAVVWMALAGLLAYGLFGV